MPHGSGKMMNLFEVSKEISDRLTGSSCDEHGRRPVYGGTEKFQTDPHWRDHILFYEYFHGDNGAGLGASHQTGWTGLVAKFIQLLVQRLNKSLAIMPIGVTSFRRRCPIFARKTSAAQASPSQDTRCIRVSEATPHWPDCASDYASGA
jgi:hypothetical protein